MNEIHKLCECGCGQETKINRDSKRHNRFIQSHNDRKGKKLSSETKLKLSISNKGKKRSENTKLKISRGHIGKKFSIEHRLKISLNNQGFTGRKHSIETKDKMSLSTINYLSNHNYSPRRGKNEDFILDQIQNNTGLEILRNNFNIARKAKKFPDGFITKYNLAIDVLEDHHFKANGELSDYDLNREAKIAKELSCMIYYIPEQEFLKNSDKEIQRFQHFLSFLDKGEITCNKEL